ncbi:hypothetical protein TNCV_983081 [Trichonephila clavipes]|nr:hypothetical protein TNCV_983081 [Trichonephila clavipes]
MDRMIMDSNAISKIKFLCTIPHRQSSGASLWGGNWVSKLLVELWFQQDGATCHTARATIDLLKDTFGDRPISHFGPVNWPPRSCDLTPLDNFCGAM